MSCQGVCDCTAPEQGNLVSNIPVKIGSPLSTACQRATTIGSIPEVTRFANFTLVDGAVAIDVVSSGGICSIPSFFQTRRGCFYDMNSRLSGSTCC